MLAKNLCFQSILSGKIHSLRQLLKKKTKIKKSAKVNSYNIYKYEEGYEKFANGVKQRKLLDCIGKSNEMIKLRNKELKQKLNLQAFGLENKNLNNNSKKIMKIKKTTGKNLKSFAFERKITRFFKRTLNSIQIQPQIKNGLKNTEKIIENNENLNGNENIKIDKKNGEKSEKKEVLQENFKDILKDLWLFIEKDCEIYENNKNNNRFSDLQKSIEAILHKIYLDFLEFKSETKLKKNFTHNFDFFTKGYGNLLSGIIHIFENRKNSHNYKDCFEEIHRKTKKIQNEIKCFFFTNFLQPVEFSSFFYLNHILFYYYFLFI